MIAAKAKVCKWCKKKFVPERAKAVCCSVDCALEYGQKVSAKAEKIRQLEDRKVIKQKKDALKSRSDWMKEAQKWFNAWVRERDRLAGYRCVSSGRLLDWSGNNVDAGHYRSTGSAPHLRFDERNCHAQSKQDNRYLSGNVVDYRIGLIERIGLKEVEELEADNTPRKYSIEDLKQIISTYKQKLKELKDGSHQTLV